MVYVHTGFASAGARWLRSPTGRGSRCGSWPSTGLGYGGSDPLPAPGLDATAASLLEALDLLGLDRPALCGTSAGAPYAVAMAGLAPGCFRRLALLSGLAPDRLAAEGGAAAWMPRLARNPRLAAALLRPVTAAAARPRVAAALLRPLDLQLRRYVGRSASCGARWCGRCGPRWARRWRRASAACSTTSPP